MENDRHKIKIKVTAHAIVRYMERAKGLKLENELLSDQAIMNYFKNVKGFSLEEIRNEMLTDQVYRFVETLGGTGKFPFDKSNLRLKMVNYTVITVY